MATDSRDTPPHDPGPGRAAPLPPLPGEHHVCPSCPLTYAALSLPAARGIIATIPQRVRDTAADVPEPAVRQRPRPDTWSVLEYVCHLRDVYVTSTIRLYRVRTEDSPQLEPMLNDLRARRFRYHTLELGAVLGELDNTVAGFLEETERVRPGGWDRVASRLPGEVRTARWLVRHAAHEGVHHLDDIRTLART